MRGQFLYPERGQKQTFFDPLPPHLVHVVIECPLIIYTCSIIKFFDLNSFQRLGQKSLKKIVGFLIQLMTPKSPFENN